MPGGKGNEEESAKQTAAKAGPSMGKEKGRLGGAIQKEGFKEDLKEEACALRILKKKELYWKEAPQEQLDKALRGRQEMSSRSSG